MERSCSLSCSLVERSCSLVEQSCSLSWSVLEQSCSLLDKSSFLPVQSCFPCAFTASFCCSIDPTGLKYLSKQFPCEASAAFLFDLEASGTSCELAACVGTAPVKTGWVPSTLAAASVAWAAPGRAGAALQRHSNQECCWHTIPSNNMVFPEHWSSHLSNKTPHGTTGHSFICTFRTNSSLAKCHWPFWHSAVT